LRVEVRRRPNQEVSENQELNVLQRICCKLVSATGTIRLYAPKTTLCS
jgi:hypothetical protein